MKPSLQLKVGHQLTMTPQLQQAIRLLQLSSLDLQTEIQTQLEKNFMLESAQETEEEEDITLHSELNENGNELEEEPQIMWETLGKHSRPFQESIKNEIEPLNPTHLSLKDHLLWQMQLTHFNEVEKLIAITLIDSINEDGFLTTSIEEISAILKESPGLSVNEDEIEAVLHHIQQFDPLGIGARNLKESLQIQLNHFTSEAPSLNKAKELVASYLELLAKKDYAALSRRLRISLKDLGEIIHLIQSLHPRPGTQIGVKSSEYIIPDVLTYNSQGKWIVELNSTLIPHLQINQYYASLIHQARSQSENQFLRNQLQEARWFLKSIENRNETLLQVATAIVQEQIPFLEQGEEAMKPLVLHDIALQLQMHDSTISRITTQKYLRTPRGIFELKYFFSSHVETIGGGECSATAIRAYIKKLIANEDPTKPLSDSKLSNLLFQRGINVARRTVAKYRESSAIPPSNERKRLI